MSHSVIKFRLFSSNLTLPYTFWNSSSVTIFWLTPTVSQDVPAIYSCQPGISLSGKAGVISKFGDVTVHSIFQITSKNVLWDQSLKDFSVYTSSIYLLILFHCFMDGNSVHRDMWLLFFFFFKSELIFRSYSWNWLKAFWRSSNLHSFCSKTWKVIEEFQTLLFCVHLGASV